MQLFYPDAVIFFSFLGTRLLSVEESEASVALFRARSVLFFVCDHAQCEGDHGGGHGAKLPANSSSRGAWSVITDAKSLSTKSGNKKIQVWSLL